MDDLRIELLPASLDGTTYEVKQLNVNTGEFVISKPMNVIDAARLTDEIQSGEKIIYRQTGDVLVVRPSLADKAAEVHNAGTQNRENRNPVAISNRKER